MQIQGAMSLFALRNICFVQQKTDLKDLSLGYAPWLISQGPCIFFFSDKGDPRLSEPWDEDGPWSVTTWSNTSLARL